MLQVPLGLCLLTLQLSTPILESYPRRKAIHDAVAATYSHATMTCPERQEDGWYYWLFNDSTLPRDIVVRSRDLEHDYGTTPGANGPELVFDPSKEEHTSLYWQSWSPSGRYWNAILQESGWVHILSTQADLCRSDWQKIRTVDTHTMECVNDDLVESKFTFGGCWLGEQVRVCHLQY